MPLASDVQINKLNTILEQIILAESISSRFLSGNLTRMGSRKLDTLVFEFELHLGLVLNVPEKRKWRSIFNGLEDSGFTLEGNVYENYENGKDIMLENEADSATEPNTVVDDNSFNTTIIIQSPKIKLLIANDANTINSAIDTLKKQYSTLLKIDSAKTNSSVYISTAAGGVLGLFAAEPIALGLAREFSAQGIDLIDTSPGIVLGVACASIVGCALIGLAMGLVYDKVRSNATNAEKTKLLLESNIKENVAEIADNTRPQSASVDPSPTN